MKINDVSILNNIEKSKDVHDLSIIYNHTSILINSIHNILTVASRTLDLFRQDIIAKIFRNLYKNNNLIVYDFIYENRIHWSVFNELINITRPDNDKEICIYYNFLSDYIKIYSKIYFDTLHQLSQKPIDYKLLNIETIMHILCKIYENYFICIASLDLSCLYLKNSCNCSISYCKCFDRDSRIIYYIDSSHNPSVLDEVLTSFINNYFNKFDREDVDLIIDFSTIDKPLTHIVFDEYINFAVKHRENFHNLIIRNLPHSFKLNDEILKNQDIIIQ